MAAPASAAVPPRGDDPGKVAGAAVAAADPQVETVLKRAKFESAQDSSEAAGVGTAPPQPDAVPEPKAGAAPFFSPPAAPEPTGAPPALELLAGASHTALALELLAGASLAALALELPAGASHNTLRQSLRAHSRSLLPLSA